MSEATEPRYEKRDVSPRMIAALVLGLAALTVGAALLMWGSFAFFQKRAERVAEPPSPLREEPVLPPPPRLQVAPEQDLQTLRQREEERLNTYGWINREAGVVRIPIERAMELLLERGVPVRPSHRIAASPPLPGQGSRADGMAVQEERSYGQ